MRDDFWAYSISFLFSFFLSSSKQVSISLYISTTVLYLFFGFLAHAFSMIFSTDCGINLLILHTLGI